MEDGGAAVPAAGGVIPGWGYAGEAGIGHRRAGQHGGDDGGVGENTVGPEGVGAGQA